MLWLRLGLSAVALAMIGVVLPLLPTVPFLLLAAFCFARSSDRLHTWLLDHAIFGPLITAWIDTRSISQTAKHYAAISIITIFSLSVILRLKFGLLVLQGVILSGVLAFIWTRPTP